MKKLGLILLAVLTAGPACHIDPGLEPTRSGFSGTIHFKNHWPEETDQVLVVAATKFPPTDITDIVLGDPLPTHVDSTDYVIYTPPADFAAVGVVWKQKDQPWDVTNIIGIYFPTEDHFTPGKLSIGNRNQMVDSINIEADLSKARRKVDSAIQGTIRTIGEWPQDSQSILVIASSPLLPSGLLDVVFGQPITAGFDSTRYSLSVQPGTYRLVATLLLEEDQPIGVSSIRGVYFKKKGDLLPGTVTIPTDTTKIKNIDITIDFTSKPFPG